MAFLFKHKIRTPSEQVKQVSDDLVDLGVPRAKTSGNAENTKTNANREQALARASKHIAQLRKMLVGEELVQTSDGKQNSEREGGTSTSQQNADIAISEMCKHGLIHQLCLGLSILDLESCKDIATCFNVAVQTKIDGNNPGIDYLLANQHIFEILSAGYRSDSTALHCGSMIRECARHVPLVRVMVLQPGMVLKDLFIHVESPMFEVAGDAFETFSDLLTKHKKITAELLFSDYEDFLQRYTKLLTSENLITKRQSLKILGELIIEQLNDGMLQFINDPRNLMVMMNLLRDESRTVQYQAFHIFKVFVANPNKPEGIADIICRNRDKLLTFLESFHNDRDNDQFKSEKAIVLQQISDLGGSI